MKSIILLVSVSSHFVFAAAHPPKSPQQAPKLLPEEVGEADRVTLQKSPHGSLRRVVSLQGMQQAIEGIKHSNQVEMSISFDDMQEFNAYALAEAKKELRRAISDPAMSFCDEL